MSRQYSKQYLYAIRNHIPIDFVITEILGLPSKIDEGSIFRFRCPLCREFNTSIKYEINLSRCFLCKKNFNPIDIFMEVRVVNFLTAVKFLGKYLKKDLSFDEAAKHNVIKNQQDEPQVLKQYKFDENRQKRDSPIRIGQLIPPLFKQIDAYNNHKGADIAHKNLLKRMENMEENFNKLYLRVEQLYHLIKLIKPQ